MMNIIECIILGVSSLRRNPLRSLLTILGIVVGVGSVVSMLSVGDGSRAMVLREIERTGGTNIIEIYRDDWDRQSGTLTRAAGKTVRRRRWQRNRAEHLKTADAYAILERVNNVVDVIVEDDMGGWNVNYEGITKDCQIVGSTAGYARSHNWHPEIGRFFSEDEVDGCSSVAVIGSRIHQDVFKGANPIGKEVKATRTSSWGRRYDVRLTVIGVMQEKGDAMDTEGWDGRFIIPITTLQQRFKGSKDVERLRIEAANTEQIESVKKASKEVLGRIHQNSGDEYQYWTATEELQIAERIGWTMKVLMGGIAGIALVVAGIGVMNIMLVSVTERTKEIGLRKALGATRHDILLQFLVEALTLTLSGGIVGAILGVLMGYTTAALIDAYAWPGSNWPAIVSPKTLLLSMAVSLAVGLFFGLYPANRAAKMTPVDALRAE